jgi:hypothetical protein
VIPTLRRSRDDVFLIGEESLLTGQETGRDTDPEITIPEIGGNPTRRRRASLHLPGSLQGVGALALLGLGAGAVAVIAALELGGGEGPVHPPASTSPRSPLISRSAAGVPAIPTARPHRPAARPAEVHRSGVHDHHQDRSRHPEPPERSRPRVTTAEPEREPTIPVAPVSSPAVTPTEPTPAPEEAPAAIADQTPDPGPPPSSSGGGPGGVESFGFER